MKKGQKRKQKRRKPGGRKAYPLSIAVSIVDIFGGRVPRFYHVKEQVLAVAGISRPKGGLARNLLLPDVDRIVLIAKFNRERQAFEVFSTAELVKHPSCVEIAVAESKEKGTGLGLFSFFLSEAVALARRSKVRKIVLDVSERDPKAFEALQNYYRTYGFTFENPKKPGNGS